jgi:uncharacterized membrane protein
VLPRKTRMTNQEIVAVKPLILILVILLVYLIAMLYQYREIAKNVGRLFKGGVVALLVMLGIIEDK